MDDVISILHYLSLELEKLKKIRKKITKPLRFRDRLLLLFGKYDENFSNIVTRIVLDFRIRDFEKIIGKISKPEMWDYICDTEDENRSLQVYKMLKNNELDKIFIREGKPVEKPE